MSTRLWKDGKFVEIDTPDALSQRVRDTLEYYREKMTYAIGEAMKTREEVAAEIVNKHDEENEELKSELRFTIASVASEQELEAYNAFTKDHLKCRTTRATGGKMPIIQQIGTGIGVITELTCPVCGAKQDITDTSVW